MTSHPHRIVFANEKGGTGKSTTAVHVAVALAFGGARVVAFDLDHRQRTMCRYFENRAETGQRRGVDLPTATCHVVEGMDEAAMETFIETRSAGADFVVIDTPGRDDPLARHAATTADTLTPVTPGAAAGSASSALNRIPPPGAVVSWVPTPHCQRGAAGGPAT